MIETDVTFAAPGPGTWELDATHRGRRPISPFLRDALMRDAGDGFTVVAERYGLPLAEVRAALVNGCLYVRVIGVGEGDKPSKMPPAWVMKVMTRVHPELRRRNRTATRTRGKRSAGVRTSTIGSTATRDRHRGQPRVPAR